jgi:hypothetical protein
MNIRLFRDLRKQGSVVILTQFCYDDDDDDDDNDDDGDDFFFQPRECASAARIQKSIQSCASCGKQNLQSAKRKFNFDDDDDDNDDDDVMMMMMMMMMKTTMTTMT